MTMTKNSLLIAFLVVAMVLFYWLYKTNSFLKLTAQSAVQQIPPIQAQVAPAASTNQKTSASTVAPITQRQNEIRSLQQQLAREGTLLESQRRQLNELKSRKDEQERQAAVSYTSRIAFDNSQIQNLSDTLEDQRLAEEDVRQAATATLREQNSSAQLARDRIDQNIHLVEQNIQETQEQISYWTTYQYQYNLPERDIRLQSLRVQLDSLREQLNDLRTQKVDLSNTALARTQNLNNLAQQQQSDLADTQDAIQNQIFTLREEVVRLQTNQARVQMALKTLNTKVIEAQENFDDQAQTVQDLETSLRKKQQELGPLR